MLALSNLISKSLPLLVYAQVDPYQRSKAMVATLLERADVRIGGDRPWDIQVHHSGFYKRVLLNGSLGLGEAYMDGWWNCDALDECIERLERNALDREVTGITASLAGLVKSKLFNLQSGARAYQIGERHYDVGNDLYENMLDRRMTYSCGYWERAETLDQAQQDKLEMCCQKLKLTPGMRVLDIGCGWGSFAEYAAQTHGVNVVGITVSREQYEFARKRCRDLSVEIRMQDYRVVDEPFDRVISVGMFEHVGAKNYRKYMEIVHRCLKPEGITLLHTIGGNETQSASDPWIDKYIFPNSLIPSARQITRAAEQLLTIEHWENIGLHYDRTLMQWHKNFLHNWPALRNRYGERFRRMWEFYLLSSAAVFRARRCHVWQVVMSKIT
jgi:cyclopropane-fatty-acyl-phospholipid synthase